MNSFSLKLMQYLMEYHPEKITDTELIEQRGKKAVHTFAQCSRCGMSVSEALENANQELFRNLIFSPYSFVREIVVDKLKYKTTTPQKTEEFVMQMLAYTNGIIKQYIDDSGENIDLFDTTENYLTAQAAVTDIINQYIVNNGL